MSGLEVINYQKKRKRDLLSFAGLILLLVIFGLSTLIPTLKSNLDKVRQWKEYRETISSAKSVSSESDIRKNNSFVKETSFSLFPKIEKLCKQNGVELQGIRPPTNEQDKTYQLVISGRYNQIGFFINALEKEIPSLACKKVVINKDEPVLKAEINFYVYQ